MRLSVVVLVSLGLSTTLAAQQEDTVVTLMSSDTVTVAVDSVLADSVPITVTRVDTVGWDFTWQVIPGSRIVTDLWRFVVTSLLCVGCVPADTVAPPDTIPPLPADSVPLPPVDTIPLPPADSVPLPPIDTTPPPPPPGGADLTLDFNDPASLGVTCGGNPCTWPYRKHDYWPTGGVNGSGAVNMHWQTGMSIGFSPVWITVPMTPHFKIRYAARQTAEMQSAGSAQKMMRLSVGGGTKIGMIESKRGNICWHWDNWDTTHMLGCRGAGLPTFNDSQWHIYEIEVDYRDLTALRVTLSFDGMVARVFTLDGSAAGNLMGNGPLTISPMVEMYSCGPSGCSSSINTGDYTVDDFTFTVLP